MEWICETRLGDDRGADSENDASVRADASTSKSSHSTVKAEPIPQLDDLCRICAGTDSTVHIFGEEGLSLHLQHQINLCLPIEVFEDDVLPLFVCRACISRLQQSYELALMCQHADTKLKNILGQRQLLQLREKAGLGHPSATGGAPPVQPGGMPTNPWPSYSLHPDTTYGTSEHPPFIPGVPTRPMFPGQEYLPHQTEPPKPVKKPIIKKPKEKYDVDYKKIQQSLAKAAALDISNEDDQSYDCCDKTFHHFAQYSSHMRLKHSIYLCEKCPSFRGSTMDEFNSHRKDKSVCKWEKKRHLCTICGKVFAAPVELKWHMKTHYGEKNFRCNECGKAFYSPILLSQHQRIHGPRKYKCEVCNKMFSLKYNLTTHIKKMHETQWTFRCNLCPASYGTEEEVTRHYMGCHAPADTRQISFDMLFTKISPFRCAMCDKYYGTKTQLDSHLKKQHSIPNAVDIPEKKFKCNICSKTFQSRAHLKVHLNVHLTVKDFKCNHCPKTFSNKHSLSSHIKLHTGELPFQCLLCSKKFRSKQALRKHQNYVHNPSRPFPCDCCEKSFKSNSLLRKHHLEVHTTERPYECPICHQKFKRLGDQKKHLEKHATGHH